jgi:parallel beta-helix repeat protein
MVFSTWLRNHSGKRAPRGQAPPRPTALRFRPQLEALEDRWVPSTLTVTNNLDSGAGSLRAEVAAAHNGDTIVFAPGLDGQTITLTSGEIDINKSITIQGPGAGLLTISGDNHSRVFWVKARQDVVLSGMTLTGGNGLAGEPGFPRVDGDGVGGAVADLGNLTMNDCTVTHNSARFGGGVVAGFKNGNFVSSLTLNNCTISDNTATENGGGIEAVTSVTINNSTVTGNSAATTFGGGIVLDFSTSTVVVSGSTVSGNSAGVSGGGIDNSAGGSLTVSTTSFCGNTPDNINGLFTDGGGNTFC